MNKNDGMNYAPVGKPQPVVQASEFVFAAAALDHGHIYGMCNGLIEAGATLKWVYDPDPAKVDTFVQQYPQVKVADSWTLFSPMATCAWWPGRPSPPNAVRWG